MPRTPQDLLAEARALEREARFESGATQGMMRWEAQALRTEAIKLAGEIARADRLLREGRKTE